MLALTVLLAVAAATPTPTPSPASRMAGAMSAPKSTQPPPKGHSLAEVAGAVKLRYPANKPVLITNDSLKQLGAGAELTTAAPAEPSPTGGGGGPTDEERRQQEKKAYWQGRYFAAQAEATSLESEEQRLIAEVARLEREFYSRDDPVQRDNVIKPAWDEAVAKLRDVQQKLPVARSAPDTIANEARRDGALPGWFRETPPAAATPAPQAQRN